MVVYSEAFFSTVRTLVTSNALNTWVLNHVLTLALDFAGIPSCAKLFRLSWLVSIFLYCSFLINFGFSRYHFWWVRVMTKALEVCPWLQSSVQLLLNPLSVSCGDSSTLCMEVCLLRVDKSYLEDTKKVLYPGIKFPIRYTWRQPWFWWQDLMTPVNSLRLERNEGYVLKTLIYKQYHYSY